MRHFSVFVLFVLIACHSMATTTTPSPKKDYLDLLTRYDIDDDVKNIPPGAPSEFWAKALATNEWVTEFRNNMAKMKSAEKKTLERLEEMPRIDDADSVLILPGWRPFCDSLLTDMGVASVSDTVPQISLLVVESDYASVFTALTRDGMAVCLTEPLMLSVAADSLLLKSIVARGVARLKLGQLQRGVYEDMCNPKGGGFGFFFTVGTPGVSLMIPLSIFKSKKKKNEDPLAKYNNIWYSREQELEAELLAFRFMQYINAADAYLEYIAFMGPEFDKLIDKKDYERAKEWSRTDFVGFAVRHSHIGNTYFPSMKQKRIEKAAKEEAKRRKKAEKAAKAGL